MTAASACTGVIFVGAVIGMLVMGYLGDLLGRKPAMVVIAVGETVILLTPPLHPY